MIMERVTKQQICHKLASTLATFLSTILALVLFSFFFFFSVSEFSPSLLTLLIALLSTLFLVSLTKKKGSLHENLVQDNLHKSQLQASLDVTHTEGTQQSEAAQRHEQQAETLSDSSIPLDCESSKIIDKSFQLNAQEYEQQADPLSDTSLPSDSESSPSSIMGVSFEIDHNRNQNVDISHSFAFDNDEEEEEDGLIEIKLPNNNFSVLTQDPDQKLVSKFFPESLFKQQCFTELLAEINEMNEDENLIEIDISMRSSKFQD
ncbi:hypothetical protein VNO77_29687 [Canavalia gladiata]|uniref:Transmembrane protein n=1 Tax=Canavalia gladiata TaxID=3824 RepID=A0AAN9KR40_CANGL